MLAMPPDRSTHYWFWEDFDNLDTVKFASTDDAATGTNLALDQLGGWSSIVTAAADNDYHLMATTKKIFDLGSLTTKQPVLFEAQISLTEANTSAANVIVGLIDTLTSGNLQDNGAGPAASYKGACFFKVDGGIVWQFETSNGSTQTTNTSIAAVSSGTTITFGIQIEADPDGVNAKVTPFVDGAAGTVHRMLLSGLSTVYAAFGVKAGSASAETLKINYLGVTQPR